MSAVPAEVLSLQLFFRRRRNLERPIATRSARSGLSTVWHLVCLNLHGTAAMKRDPVARALDDHQGRRKTGQRTHRADARQRSCDDTPQTRRARPAHEPAEHIAPRQSSLQFSRPSGRPAGRPLNRTIEGRETAERGVATCRWAARNLTPASPLWLDPRFSEWRCLLREESSSTVFDELCATCPRWESAAEQQLDPPTHPSAKRRS